MNVVAQVNFAFSLGWKVDVCSLSGHTKHEISEMMTFIKESKLCEIGGVVLAVNARLLSKNMAPFEAFLDAYPEAQLLCWVGSGEPKIAKRKADRILKHFQRHGSGQRVGFDVQVSDKTDSFWSNQIFANTAMCKCFLCSTDN